jgi:hypothetical protein
MTTAHIEAHISRIKQALAELRAVATTPEAEDAANGWWRLDTAAMHTLEAVQALVRIVANHGQMEKAPACFVEVHHTD